MDEGMENFLDIIIALFVPPLGVLFKFGCKPEFWICLILTLLAYLPGIVYAVYVITKVQKNKTPSNSQHGDKPDQQ